MQKLKQCVQHMALSRASLSTSKTQYKAQQFVSYINENNRSISALHLNSNLQSQFGESTRPQRGKHTSQTCHTFYAKSARRSAEAKVQTILISPYRSTVRQTLWKYQTTQYSFTSLGQPNRKRVSIQKAKKWECVEGKVNDCKWFALSKGGVWFLSSTDARSPNTLSQSLLQTQPTRKRFSLRTTVIWLQVQPCNKLWNVS